MPLVKEMLPYIASVDRRWRKFPQGSFNITNFVAHKELYHCIRNKIESLQNKAKKEREDEEKAALEKIKEEKAAELDAEHKILSEKNRQLAQNERITTQAN